MTEQDFLEKYSGAPLDEEDIASGASKVEDNKNLSQAAVDFLEAHEAFIDALDETDFEWG